MEQEPTASQRMLLVVMTESSARNADIRKDLLHIPTATRQQQGIDDIEHARAGHEHKIFEFVAQYLEFKEAWRVDEVQALESVLLPQGAGHWSRSRYCRRRPISISLSVCPLHASTNLHIPAVPRSEFRMADALWLMHALQEHPPRAIAKPWRQYLDTSAAMYFRSERTKQMIVASETVFCKMALPSDLEVHIERVMRQAGSTAGIELCLLHVLRRSGWAPMLTRLAQHASCSPIEHGMPGLPGIVDTQLCAMAATQSLTTQPHLLRKLHPALLSEAARHCFGLCHCIVSRLSCNADDCAPLPLDAFLLWMHFARGGGQVAQFAIASVERLLGPASIEARPRSCNALPSAHITL